MNPISTSKNNLTLSPQSSSQIERKVSYMLPQKSYAKNIYNFHKKRYESNLTQSHEISPFIKEYDQFKTVNSSQNRNNSTHKTKYNEPEIIIFEEYYKPQTNKWRSSISIDVKDHSQKEKNLNHVSRFNNFTFYGKNGITNDMQHYYQISNFNLNLGQKKNSNSNCISQYNPNLNKISLENLSKLNNINYDPNCYSVYISQNLIESKGENESRKQYNSSLSELKSNEYELTTSKDNKSQFFEFLRQEKISKVIQEVYKKKLNSYSQQNANLNEVFEFNSKFFQSLIEYDKGYSYILFEIKNSYEKYIKLNIDKHKEEVTKLVVELNTKNQEIEKLKTELNIERNKSTLTEKKAAFENENKASNESTNRSKLSNLEKNLSFIKNGVIIPKLDLSKVAKQNKFECYQIAKLNWNLGEIVNQKNF